MTDGIKGFSPKHILPLNNAKIDFRPRYARRPYIGYFRVTQFHDGSYFVEFVDDKGWWPVEDVQEWWLVFD